MNAQHEFALMVLRDTTLWVSRSWGFFSWFSGVVYFVDSYIEDSEVAEIVVYIAERYIWAFNVCADV